MIDTINWIQKLPRGKSPLRLFWNKIHKSADIDACWNWNKARDKDGYGLFSIRVGDKYHTFRSHRVAWYLSKGEYR